MKSIAFAFVLVTGVATSAHADQCQLVDSGTAVRALQLLHDHPNVVTYCEPCGDRAPGDVTNAAWVATERDRSGSYQVVIDRREVDLAYTFVQTGPDRFDNLAQLAGCPASGVSNTLTIHAPEPEAVVIAPPTPVQQTVPQTTYVIHSPPSVSFVALLGTCAATSAACTLGLFFVLRRRRIAMKPRAIELADRLDPPA
jgi:hypothetical protein